MNSIISAGNRQKKNNTMTLRGGMFLMSGIQTATVNLDEANEEYSIEDMHYFSVNVEKMKKKALNHNEGVEDPYLENNSNNNKEGGSNMKENEKYGNLMNDNN